jgi:hypothetical protein
MVNTRLLFFLYVQYFPGLFIFVPYFILVSMNYKEIIRNAVVISVYRYTQTMESKGA